jgi:uncharacterized damage-inducible protein DinB
MTAEPAISPALLRELFAHMEWADGLVWQAVRPLGDGEPDAALRDRLLHIHVVQRAFLNIWSGQPMKFPEADEFPRLAGLEAWARPYYAEARQHLEQLDTAQLSLPVELPWAAELAKRFGRDPEPVTLAETGFQVTSHSTYHRGQVNTRLRELGVDPPLVDYIAWLWIGRPAAEWGGNDRQAAR